MPCMESPVLTAITNFDFETHFARDPQHREEFAAWLAPVPAAGQGLVALRRRVPPAVGAGYRSDWVGLKFTGSNIELFQRAHGGFSTVTAPTWIALSA